MEHNKVKMEIINIYLLKEFIIYYQLFIFYYQNLLHKNPEKNLFQSENILTT